MELETKSKHNPVKAIIKPDCTELAVGLIGGVVIFKLPKELHGGTIFNPSQGRSFVAVEINRDGIEFDLTVSIFQNHVSLEVSYYDDDDMMHVLHEASAFGGK
jgi:hypothetical protein